MTNHNRSDPGPIQADLHDLMNAVAHGLDDIFNGKNCPADQKKTGFFLTAFNMGEPGRFNYISNCEGLDMLAMLKDVTARIEGRLSTPGNA